MYDLGIVDGKLYLDGTFTNSNIYIKNGKISNISNSYLSSKITYNALNKMVLPGFIDPHVHFELNTGNYTSKDDFYNGSISAAFGGVTTVIDFLDPIKSTEEFSLAFNSSMKRSKRSIIDYGFHNTLAEPISPINKFFKVMKEKGIRTIKIFTTYSDSNRRTSDKKIEKILKMTKNENFMLLAHVENDDYMNYDKKTTIRKLNEVRPEESEIIEVAKLSEIVELTQGKLYIVHLNCGSSVELIKNKYNHLLNNNIFIESCPHYFYFTCDKYRMKENYLYTMIPPLRKKYEQIKLRKNIDYINTIGTDHCSYNSKEKNKQYIKDIPMGVGGVEFSFSLMFNLFGEKIIDKFTKNTAKLFEIYPNKGSLIPGTDADITIFDPNKEFTIKNHNSKSDYTIYKNMNLKGKVISTILRGEFIVKDGVLINETQGKYIFRELLI